MPDPPLRTAHRYDRLLRAPRAAHAGAEIDETYADGTAAGALNAAPQTPDRRSHAGTDLRQRQHWKYADMNRSRLRGRTHLLAPLAVAAAMLAACTGPEPEAAPAPTTTDAATPSTSAPAGTSTNDPDVAAILQAGRDRTRAMLEADTGRLDVLLDDAFVAVHITGYEQPKAEWLAQIRSGDMAYHTVEEQSATVTIDGDTAVLTSRNRVTATINGSRGTWPLESTTSYVKKDGTWLAMRSRSTTF